MTFGVHVKGGTGAGSKRPKLPANTIPWECACRVFAGTGTRHDPTFTLPEHTTFWQTKRNPGYLKRCIDCGTDRDPS